MREVLDPNGRAWLPVAVPFRGAHLRLGAKLGFRPADDPDAEAILTAIQWNSAETAEISIAQMGDREMARRLELAWIAAGCGERVTG
ncbi:hypothetical protein BH20GEM2_BH20GEM2_08350 [soil metagenome]|jgi:hypothetical protein